jgi:hypothetical protein
MAEDRAVLATRPGTWPGQENGASQPNRKTTRLLKFRLVDLIRGPGRFPLARGQAEESEQAKWPPSYGWWLELPERIGIES